MTLRFAVENPQLQVWVAFHQLRDLLRKLVDTRFKEIDLTSERYKVLLVLKNHPEEWLPQGEVARWMFRSPNTMSELLSRMEQEGLLRRRKDPQDRRVSRVQMTTAGEEAYWRASKVGWELVQEALSGLTQEELDTFKGVLESVRRRVKALVGVGEEETVSLDDTAQLALLIGG